MSAIGEGHHEDCLRAFLRLRVRDLGGLLPQVAELVRQSASTLTEKSTKLIPQANQIALVCAASISTRLILSLMVTIDDTSIRA